MRPSDTIADLVHKMLDGGGRKDALIIVPPFMDNSQPSLGVHLLQAEARQAGFDVAILYASLLFAQQIGTEQYNAIASGTTDELIGETCFRAAAFGPAGNVDALAVDEAEFQSFGSLCALDFDAFSKMNRLAPSWCDELCAAIAEYSFPIIGCTTTFEQTCASLAILKKIKEQNPATITILGGANCEGEMADGVLSINDCVDYVFSGESEKSFVSFLTTHSSGAKIVADKKIIHSSPNTKLDELAVPTYDDFFKQLSIALPNVNPRTTWLPYESSRGCWWGEKHHCTFCGLNGEGMGFREKSPDIVIRDLTRLAQNYNSKAVLMVDNIMPHTYFNSLLPRLAKEVPELFIFYEQKANLSLTKLELLHAAGVRFIQPGIESLSTPLLKLMKKGVKASQNIALLRYARSVNMDVRWNFIGAFPGDRAEWYRDTIRIMSKIAHLPPPRGLFSLRIHRFSPYFNQPANFGVSNVRAIPAYDRIFPAESDVQKIAYHFLGDYESGYEADGLVGPEIDRLLADWKRRWKNGVAPQLHVSKITEDIFILHDTRGIDELPEVEFVDREQARICLWGVRKNADAQQAVEWALRRSACLMIDGEVVPLATAAPDLMHQLEIDDQSGKNSATGAASVRDQVVTA